MLPEKNPPKSLKYKFKLYIVDDTTVLGWLRIRSDKKNDKYPNSKIENLLGVLLTFFSNARQGCLAESEGFVSVETMV